MVFSTTTLFKGIPCPEGDRCRLVNCIYAHTPIARSATSNDYPSAPQGSREPPLKKRRVEGSTGDAAAATKTVEGQPKTLQEKVVGQLENPRGSRAAPALSLPGPPKSQPSSARQIKASEEKPVLNPKTLSQSSAGHGERARFLQLLHGEYVRLNGHVEKNIGRAFGETVVQKKHLLSKDELISCAVEHEAEMMVRGASLYKNVFKARFHALKKMTWEDFLQDPTIAHPRVQTASNDAEKVAAALQVNPALSGLNERQEVEVARALVIPKLEYLAEHGYISHPPSAQEVETELSGAPWHFECMQTGCNAKIRLDSFDPNDTDKFKTSICQYHPRRPSWEKNGKYHYACCGAWQYNGEVVPGCKKAEHHIISLKDSPNLLEHTIPFIDTPYNSRQKKHPNGSDIKAVTFDCEMGHTTIGAELLRLTAISWPDGELLVDILVRPRGVVLDYVTEFSGVCADDYDAEKRVDRPLANLEIVDNVETARERLCSYLNPHTILIGHAIDNDLIATRLCHPTIIDTVVVFPHPRGLPRRSALRVLTKNMLNHDIQTGGDGHSSKEDCIATGELVRFKLKEVVRQWTQYRRWVVREDGRIETPNSWDLKMMWDDQLDMLKQAGIWIKR